MASVFFSYSHADETHRDQLEKQLSMLKRQGVIDVWHDRRIGAGQEVDKAIDEHVNSDDIILLLVSADFLASNYCYEIEMNRAMERHEAGEAIVIPVILRACDWHHAPFGKLKAVPRDGKPITQWADIDEAFLEVAKAVRGAASRTTKAMPSYARVMDISTESQPEPQVAEGPRSSNLRLAKSYTQRDKDRFQDEAFEFMARFFENSLTELSERNQGIEGVFRRVDANRFFATIYRHGKDISKATVFMGGDMFRRGINYVDGHATSSNTLNECLNVEADDQALYLIAMGMMNHNGQRKLTYEGASELFWENLISPLQGRW